MAASKLLYHIKHGNNKSILLNSRIRFSYKLKQTALDCFLFILYECRNSFNSVVCNGRVGLIFSFFGFIIGLDKADGEILFLYRPNPLLNVPKNK